MKTKLWLLLGGLMLAVSPAQAQFTYTTNGDTFYYTIINSTITITNFSGSNGVVSIPTNISGTPVTSIGSNAFANSILTGVTIPNSVTNIGSNAFSACYELTNVTIPGSVTSIGDFAFYYGSSLTNAIIPASVTNIGAGPFAECSGLTAITVITNDPSYSSLAGVLFNKNQTTLIQYPIGNAAESYTIPGTVTSIGNSAFASFENLTNITIPGSVTSIGANAFIYSFLDNITIPNSVTNIGDSAFAYSFLASVTIPATITTIGDSVFAGTLLTNVTIPASVTSIGPSAFYNCSSLTNVIIPNTVTNIGTNAFAATSLINVTIPAGVTKIGDYAFANCDSLVAVYFQGNAPAADSTVFVVTFGGQNYYYATAYYLPGTTGWGSFSTNTDLPTAIWTTSSPLILTTRPGFGVQGNQFGFTISWATNLSLIVQASTNLAHPVWTPVATNTLSNGSSYFSDPQWTNYRSRFYRISAP